MSGAGNTRIVLKRQVGEGPPSADDFELRHAPIAEPGEGEVLTRTLYLSLDPYMRGVISGRHLGHSVEPGQVMPGETVGRVVRSRHPALAEKDLVTAQVGWQAYGVSAGERVRPILPGVAPLSTYLGILGMPGLTAYVGFLHLAEPVAGDVVVVSAASGAVGSVVGQLAKIRGCRAVGIAGSDDKCGWVVREAGFDACVNYRRQDLRDALREACPIGIDVYFDNVGGDTLQAAMEQLALGARVVLCGLVSQYNSPVPPPGPNPALVIKARATVRGLVVYDHEHRREQFLADALRWYREGRLKFLEEMNEGLESAPAAFARLMRGENRGKVVVRVAPD